MRHIFRFTWTLGVLVVVALPATSIRGASHSQTIRLPEDVLACGREALGGEALLAVASLELKLETIPDPGYPTGRPSTDTVTLSFPGQFRQVSEGRQFDGRPIGTSVRRLDGRLASMGNVSELDAVGVESIRDSFARAAVMWLLRETPARPLTWTSDVADEGGNLRLSATGPEGFNIGLFLDRTTCLPSALAWERPPNMGDSLRARGGGPAGWERYTVRHDLMDYREFAGVRLPTRIRNSTDDVVMSEQTLTTARVNSTFPAGLFRPGS